MLLWLHKLICQVGRNAQALYFNRRVYHGFLAERYIYILYGELSPIFFFFNFLTQDITQKLGMLQEEYDNATAMTRTLEANLTGKKSHIWRYFIKI